jgi:hypothetical protein
MYLACVKPWIGFLPRLARKKKKKIEQDLVWSGLAFIVRILKPVA